MPFAMTHASYSKGRETTSFDVLSFLSWRVLGMPNQTERENQHCAVLPGGTQLRVDENLFAEGVLGKILSFLSPPLIEKSDHLHKTTTTVFSVLLKRWTSC